VRILFQLNRTNQQRQLEKLVWIFPIKLAMYATALRNQGNEVIWDSIDDGSFDRIITSESQIDIPFLQLPHADRILTDAFNSKWQNNGNFKCRPGTYIQSTSSCWWSKCSFCCEQGKVNEIREVNDVISEIKECKELGAVEIFDDSATFPTGRWLDEFCHRFSNEFGKSIKFSCNMRLIDLDYSLLRASNFRMLLFGLESANQETLDRIKKGVKVGDWNFRISTKIGKEMGDVKYVIKAAKAGLEPHIAVIFGWEWETDADAINTLKLVWWLLRKGYAKTAQASFIYQQGIKGNENQRHFVKDIYGVWKYPDFWFNKLRDIKNKDDLKYFWRQIKVGLCQS